MPPETKSRKLARHLKCIVPPGVHCEDGSCQGVFWLCPERVDGPSVPEGACPLLQDMDMGEDFR